MLQVTQSPTAKMHLAEKLPRALLLKAQQPPRMLLQTVQQLPRTLLQKAQNLQVRPVGIFLEQRHQCIISSKCKSLAMVAC